MKLNKNTKICIVGLGYVGLPLAISFAEKYITIGYDQSEERIKELDLGYDKNKELSKYELKKSSIPSRWLRLKILTCD